MNDWRLEHHFITGASNTIGEFNKSTALLLLKYFTDFIDITAFHEGEMYLWRNNKLMSLEEYNKEEAAKENHAESPN
jgi:hypothetical protein